MVFVVIQDLRGPKDVRHSYSVNNRNLINYKLYRNFEFICSVVVGITLYIRIANLDIYCSPKFANVGRRRSCVAQK